MVKLIANRYIPFIVFCATIFVSSAVCAATKEQAVKAGFVYHLTRFTTWPESAFKSEKFNLCIAGNEKLGGGLEALYGKLVGDKAIILRRDLEDQNLHTCHLIFIAKGNLKNTRKVLKKLINLPVLTVSDSPNFIDVGGMVGLVRDGKRVGFEVNLIKTTGVGIGLHSQLLKLAKKVKRLK